MSKILSKDELKQQRAASNKKVTAEYKLTGNKKSVFDIPAPKAEFVPASLKAYYRWFDMARELQADGSVLGKQIIKEEV